MLAQGARTSFGLSKDSFSTKHTLSRLTVDNIKYPGETRSIDRSSGQKGGAKTLKKVPVLDMRYQNGYETDFGIRGELLSE